MRVFDILKEQDPPEIPPRKNNVVKVDFTKGFIFSTNLLPSSISTPEFL